MSDEDDASAAADSDFERHRNDPLAVSAREYGTLAWRIGRAIAPIAAARGDETAGRGRRDDRVVFVDGQLEGVSGDLWTGRWMGSDRTRSQTDFNGSAKIALIGIGESRRAWSVLMEAGRATANGVPARAVSMLEELDAAVRGRFPRVDGVCPARLRRSAHALSLRRLRVGMVPLKRVGAAPLRCRSARAVGGTRVMVRRNIDNTDHRRTGFRYAPRMKALARRIFVSQAVAVLLLAGGPGLLADTYPRQPGIDARHYAVRLTLLTSDSNEIQAEAAVTIRIVTPGTPEAVLDLTSASPDGKGMTVTASPSNGRAVRVDHRDNRLHLPAAGWSDRGAGRAFTIAYHGVPADGLRLLNTIHGDRTAFSENWYNRARQWLPTIDHPADKATGELIVTTRSDYQVVSNGVLVEQVDLPGGLRRTHWKQDAPISSWLYSLGVARFIVRQGDVVRGVPLSYWAFPQDADKGLAALEKDARGSFEFFSDRVGPYAYAKLAHVEAAGMGGGIEHASNIFYGEKGVTAGNAPVVHETAHQWFGDSVTENDWNDVWLSEGFATYFTLLYTEHAERPRRVRRRSPPQPRRRAATRADAAEHARRARQPRRGDDGAEQSPGVREGRVDAAHAARPDRHRAVLARHQALLPAVCERAWRPPRICAARWKRCPDRICGGSSRSG